MRVSELSDNHKISTESRIIGREEILAFARKYDNQPIHVDEEAARRLGFRDLIAPGFMTVAVAWGLFIDTGVMENHGEGGIAVKTLRWYEPVYPNDMLRADVVFTTARRTSKGRGLVEISFEVFNQHDRRVLEFETVGLHTL